VRRLWQYNYSNELYHKNGYKYVDRIKTSKGWRYIYDTVLGGDKKKAMQKAADNYALAATSKSNANYNYKSAEKTYARTRMSPKYKPGTLTNATDRQIRSDRNYSNAVKTYSKAEKAYNRSVLGMAENTGKAVSNFYKRTKDVYNDKKRNIKDTIGIGAKKKVQKAADKYALAAQSHAISRSNAEAESRRIRKNDSGKNSDAMLDNWYNAQKKNIEAWDRDDSARYNYKKAVKAYDSSMLGKIEKASNRVGDLINKGRTSINKGIKNMKYDVGMARAYKESYKYMVSSAAKHFNDAEHWHTFGPEAKSLESRERAVALLEVDSANQTKDRYYSNTTIGKIEKIVNKIIKSEQFKNGKTDEAYYDSIKEYVKMWDKEHKKKR